MGICTCCGQSAGWFRSLHPECEAKRKEGCREITVFAQAMAEGKKPLTRSHDMDPLAKNKWVSAEEVRHALVRGWETAVESCLADRLLSSDEETKLMQYAGHFDLSQQDLDKNGAYSRITMSGVLRDVVERKIPDRINVTGPIPFNLQKGESLVWIFSNVPYHEEKTTRHYEGTSSGLSFRVMKGITYRVGQYKGRPVDTSSVVLADTGLLGITTKNLYFTGTRQSFRIPYGKIVSFTPYSDGFGLHRDAASAKPQIFVTGNGWFVYSLATQLAEWQRECG